MSQEKSAKFDITPKEGAIVFKDGGIEFYYPKKGSIELVETFEFLTFAMLKLDWLAEWHEYRSAAEALADLAGVEAEETVWGPHLTLIEGGKANEDEDKDE